MRDNKKAPHRSGPQIQIIDRNREQRDGMIMTEQQKIQTTPALDRWEEIKSTLFIRSMEGNRICIRLGKWEATKTLKQRIQGRTGIPPCKQFLLYTGKVLQEDRKLIEYGIGNDSTICLSTRLRGGCSGTSSKGPASFKDAVKGKMEPQMKTKHQATTPGAYIVEQTTHNPSLTIAIPEVNEIHADYLTKAVICRFNVFWPKPEALHQWIYSIWT